MARNRQYDHEYKIQVIKLAKELGNCAKAATDLGIFIWMDENCS